MKEVLIVDGYNIIGAWSSLVELKKENLELARERLIDILKEYKAFTGREVIVVFDAHQTGSLGTSEKIGGVRVIYTNQNETADEMIERLVYEAEKKKARIYVATSDYTEQQVTFGGGALRISANELQVLVKEAEKAIQEKIRDKTKNQQSKRTTVSDVLAPDVALILEKWRRKKD
jgi:predicted RNA-binding protein with PIN domain